MSLLVANVLHHLRKLRKERARPTTSAGWFYDPQKLAPYRYWNGSKWTDETRDELPDPDET